MVTSMLSLKNCVWYYPHPQKRHIDHITTTTTRIWVGLYGRTTIQERATPLQYRVFNVFLVPVNC